MTPEEITFRWLDDNGRKIVAQSIGRSRSLIDQWCVTPKSDEGGGRAHSPARLLLESIFALRAANHANADYVLHAMLIEAGYLPPVRIEEEPCDPSDISVLAAATKEHADIISTWAASVTNGLSLSELEQFQREIREQMAVLMRWDRGVHNAIIDAEEQLHKERRGSFRPMAKFYQLRDAARRRRNDATGAA